jgi:predicted transcriptional regulator
VLRPTAGWRTPPPSLDAQQSVQALGDLPIGGTRLVLVDQRSPLVVVAHPSQQIAQRDAHVSGQRVPCVTNPIARSTGHHREQATWPRITDRDTLVAMASAISVRLDDEALRALSQLESVGLSRSEAIRRAILESAARLNRRAALAAEAAALEADEDDRREMLEVAALMESLRATG